MDKKIIEDDKDKFTKSDCKCSFCITTQNSVDEWKDFTVKTNLQKRMKEVVSEIEKRSKKS